MRSWLLRAVALSGGEPLAGRRDRGHVGREVVYECRRCGTTLDGDEEVCPVCSSPEIARYVIT